MRRIVVGLIALLTLAGCATPQMQTQVRLIPPIEAAGRVCVRSCETQLAQCQSVCQTRQQACIKSLEPDIEAAYADALKQYALDLQRYAIALRHYELQMRLEWLHRFPHRHPFDGLWWEPWPPYHVPYAEPVLPTRDALRTALEKTRCPSDCGCLPTFDTCFTGCGGQRVNETVCVANCPTAK